MMLMSKILLGVVVGLGYGNVVGGLVLLIALMAGGPPVDLMLDYSKIVRAFILLVTIICSLAGAFVGLVVTLLRVDKIKARTISYSLGCVILAGIVLMIWPQLKNELSAIDSFIQVIFLFSIFLLLFVMFPIGLAATGVIAVRTSDKLASR